MNAKKKRKRVELNITADIIANATVRNSAACVIADAIKAQVEGARDIKVDLAACSWSDREAGFRYTYLTPDAGKTAIFAFDRGIRPAPFDLHLRAPVLIAPILTAAARAERRAARLAELEAKEADGALTRTERRDLTKLRTSPIRSSTAGPATIVDGTVHGHPKRGRVKRPAQLLPSHARVFGARIANRSELDDLLEAARAQGRAEAQSEAAS